MTISYEYDIVRTGSSETSFRGWCVGREVTESEKRGGRKGLVVGRWLRGQRGRVGDDGRRTLSSEVVELGVGQHLVHLQSTHGRMHQ